MRVTIFLNGIVFQIVSSTLDVFKYVSFARNALIMVLFEGMEVK